MKIQARWGHPGPTPGNWAHYCNDLPVERMSIVVASSVPGCKVYEGVFIGDSRNDGNVEHLREQFGEGVLVPANKAFLLTPDCVHESMLFEEPTQRTFLRVASYKENG